MSSYFLSYRFSFVVFLFVFSSALQKDNMHKTEWYNELKPTENELKNNIAY